MKNWQPLVFGPALAIESTPGLSWRKLRVEFILELVAGAAGAGAGGVAALDHEVVDHAVEDGAIVKALAGQEDEVVDRVAGLCRRTAGGGYRLCSVCKMAV